MKKREFLRTSGMLALGAVVAPGMLTSCNNEAPEKEEEETNEKPEATVFELPELGYGFDALAPHIDERTMTIHHGKHHAGYVKKLNAALKGHKLSGMQLNQMLRALSDSEADLKVRQNGGGHYNHSLFWKVIGPNAGGEPTGKIEGAIRGSFDSFENFKNAFAEAALGVFGSGWAWLCVNAEGKLFVTDTPNQDNPLMANLAEEPGAPILGLDVWEHAYYLNYQNKRGEYVNSFFDIINWEQVNEEYNKATS